MGERGQPGQLPAGWRGGGDQQEQVGAAEAVRQSRYGRQRAPCRCSSTRRRGLWSGRRGRVVRRRPAGRRPPPRCWPVAAEHPPRPVARGAAGSPRARRCPAPRPVPIRPARRREVGRSASGAGRRPGGPGRRRRWPGGCRRPAVRPPGSHHRRCSPARAGPAPGRQEPGRIRFGGDRLAHPTQPGHDVGGLPVVGPGRQCVERLTGGVEMRPRLLMCRDRLPVRGREPAHPCPQPVLTAA